MSIIHRLCRRSRKSVSARLASVLAVGALFALPALAPSVAGAQSIEKVSGAKFNNTVNDIYADNIYRDTAVNAFKTFELDAGHIANMHFGPESNPNGAGNLMNFVKQQVNISGTVNAVRNDAIGGNIYFLSPNGVVVGSSGVINAASVNFAVPTSSYYNGIVGSNGVKEDGFTKSLSDITSGQIPLNPSGTITVSGKINAVDGASMRAGKVNLKSGAAVISRDSLDYSTLVNIGNTGAGLTGNLKIQKSGDSGAITIAAVGDNAEKWNFTNVSLAPEVTIANGATVISDGAVNLTANAQNTGSMMVSSVSATVDVEGAVTGRTVNIKSTAGDEFAIVKGEDFKQFVSLVKDGKIDLPTIGADLLGILDVDLAVAVHDTKATVNIGNDAVIKATGKDVTDSTAKAVTRAINISADSEIKGAIATNPESFTGDMLDRVTKAVQEQSGSAVLDQEVQDTSIGIGVLKNTATVNANGSLTTTDEAGGVAISTKTPLTFEAEVDNKLEHAGSQQASGGDDNAFLLVGLGVVGSRNNSTVNLANSAEVGGTFTANAEARNNVKLSVSAMGSDNATVATAISVLDHDSAASVNDAATIRASDVSMNATNTVQQINLKAANQLGTGKEMPKNTGFLTTTGKYIDHLKDFAADKVISDIRTDLGIASGTAGSDSALFDELGKLFNAGMSLNISDADNAAKVTLAKDASIEASGNVDISSAVNTNSLRVNANGKAGNAPKGADGSEQKMKVEASVIYADIATDADVIVEDGDADKHASISGKNVKIVTDNTFKYTNIDQLEQKLKSDLVGTKIKTAKKEIQEDYAALTTAWDEYKKKSARFSKVTDAAAKLLSDLDTLKEGVEDYREVKNILLAFISPASYGTFTVGPSSAGGRMGQADANSKFAVAGAADLANVTDNSKITIGKNASITAAEKVDLASAMTRTDASVNGVIGLTTSGDQNAAGGIFSRYSTNRTANVAIGEGAAVTGAEINANAAGKTDHVSVVAGAGMAAKDCLNGMIGMVVGNDTAAVDVADGAALTAKNNGGVNLNAKNDTTITNVAGSLGASTAAGLGVSLAYTDVDRNSLVTMGKAAVTGGSAAFSATQGCMINSAAVAGGVVTNDDSADPSLFAKSKTWLLNNCFKVRNSLANINEKTKAFAPQQLKDAMKIKENKMLPTNIPERNPQAGQALPQVSIGGAGSVALNLGNSATKAAVDGATITLTKDSKPGSLSVMAKDTGFTGAWGGAAGIAWNNHSGANNQNSRSVGFGGAVGWSSGTNTVLSSIRNSTVDAALTNSAEKSGATVAGGLGLAIAKSGSAAGGSSTSVAASLSAADVENNVTAELTNNKINSTGTTAGVQNRAYDTDTLVTGGINASIANGESRGTALGGSITANLITNNVHADIKDGSIKATTLSNTALTKITEVGAGVGVSVSASEGSTYGFEGVAAYNKLDNNVRAVIDGAGVNADAVNVMAGDTNESMKAYDEDIKKSGLDPTGESYAENISGALDAAGNKALSEKSVGNKIVAGALGVAVSAGSSGGSAAAAISIEEIDNDFTAEIKNNSTINATSLDVNAKSDTLAVGVGAGVGVPAKSWGGAGSFAWQTTQNDVTAGVAGSTITADSLKLGANSGATEINVAGQVSVGRTAVGLAGTYNDLDNTTTANLSGSTVNTKTADGTAVNVSAKNSGSVYAVTAGVSASTGTTAINGAVAVNRGRNDLRATVDGSSLQQTKSLSVATDDTTNKLAVAGGFTSAQGVAVGGALAYNGVGDQKRQTNSAAVSNTTIAGVNRPEVSVTAKDASGLTTIGTGVALSIGAVSVQGAAAVGIADKDVTAGMENVLSAEGSPLGDTLVKADTADKFTTTADVAAVSKDAAIGAGVAVTHDNTKTNVDVKGGSITARSFEAKAAERANILTVGVGVGAAYGTGASVTGSVAVNHIDTNTQARLSDEAKVTADEGSVLVNAMSDETIANYAGALSVSIEGAAIGGSVSVNRINSETRANVGDGVSVSGTGNRILRAKDTVADNAVNHDYVDKDAFEAWTSLADKRSDTNYRGVAVTASGTHTIKSFLVNAGIAAEGAAVNGTVNVNEVGGSTMATVGSAEGSGATVYGRKGDVSVIAHDYTNMAGIVGTADVEGVGAGISLGSDTNKIARVTEAGVFGNYLQANDTEAYDIQAEAFKVEAASRQGISSLTTGLGGAGGGAGVGSTTSVALLGGRTAAYVSDAYLTAKDLDVVADHKSDAHMMGVVLGAAAEGAGVGIAVGVVEDSHTTEAATEEMNAQITDTSNVMAKNELDLTYNETGAGLSGGVSAAGSVGVANVGSTVSAKTQNSSFGGTGKNRAQTVNVVADNTIDFTQRAGVGTAGVVGVGVGVSVNTIDSRVNALVQNSTIAADEIKITAKENRDVDQLAVNAGIGGVAAAGANVMITNVGKQIQSVYGEELDAKYTISTENIYKDVNNTLNNGALTQGAAFGADDGETAGNGAAKTNVTLKTPEQSVVGVAATNSSLTGINVSIAGDAVTHVNMTNAAGGLSSFAAANGAYGVLDVARNVSADVANTTINADNKIEVDTKLGGLSNLNTYQGALALNGAINIAYSRATAVSDNRISLFGNTMNANNISIGALDESATLVDAIGVEGSKAVAASFFEGQALSSGKVGVELDGKNDLTAAKEIDISVRRVRENADSKEKEATAKVTAKALSASGSVGGAGIIAAARDTGDVSLDLRGGENKLRAKTIRLSTENSPKLSAETGTINAALIGTASATWAETSTGTENEKGKDYLTTKLSIGDNTVLNARTVNISNTAAPEQDTRMRALSAALGASVGINQAKGNVFSEAVMDLGRLDLAKGATVSALNSNKPAQKVDAAGVSAGGLVASGTNQASSTNKVLTTTTAAGTTGNRLDAVTIDSVAAPSLSVSVDGSGGAVIGVSPHAAWIERNAEIKGSADISGNWNADSAAFKANTSDTTDESADAILAAVAGGSGVRIFNKSTQDSLLNLSGATVKTTGAQTYTARNTLNLKQEEKAGGYGGVTGADSAIENTIAANAKVSLGDTNNNGEKVTLSGDRITVNALNDHTIVSRNQVQGAGVVPILIGKNTGSVTVNESISAFNADVSTMNVEIPIVNPKTNAIEIDNVDGKDVTFGASDTLDFDIEANAVNQGSFMGAASAEGGLSLSRTGAVDLAGSTKIVSGRDAKLYADAENDDTAASSRLILFANAHNGTLIPLKTAPKLTDTFSEKRNVTVGENAAVETLRHTEFQADSGRQYIEESAREFQIWGSGEVGSRRLTSTALGKSEVTTASDNAVVINGKVNAGVHNTLDIDIEGNLVRKGSTADDAYIDDAGLKVTSRQDWFAPESAVKSVDRNNPYYSRYTEVQEVMKEYGPSSAEYGSLKAEADALLGMMRKDGFVYTDENGNEAILETIPIPAIVLGDIHVSGGNIYVTTDRLEGKDNLSTGGEPHVYLTNKGNSLLMVSDVKIDDRGGRLYINNKLEKEATGDSSILIRSTGKKDSVSTPDIVVTGDIENISGNVSIENKSCDVEITGAVNGLSVNISAEQGSMKLSNPQSLVNVGGDPITKYQFDEDVSKKIQKKISELALRGQTELRFEDYDQYRAWLKNEVGLSDNEIRYATSEGAGYIAGGNISITAKDVNINGLIQSGYSRYMNTISAEDLTAIEERYKTGNGGTLADADVIGNGNYQVGQKGKIWNSEKKMWDYAVPIYYNPATGHLLTDDIDVQGGRIEITGNICSTGNGRIVAAEGAADISIDTAGTDKDLYIGAVTNRDREGLIRLKDTGRNLVTDYMYMNDSSYNGQGYYTYAFGESPSPSLWDWSFSGDAYKYTPDVMSLKWTGGTGGQTIYDKYYNKTYASFFGLFKLWSTGTTDELISQIGDDISSVQTTTRTTSDNDPMSSLEFFQSGVDQNLFDFFRQHPGGFVIQSEAHKSGEMQKGQVNASKMQYTNWTHTKGTVTYSWTETQDNYVSSTSTLMASHPIDVGFGTSDGNLNINAGGNVFFTEDAVSATERQTGSFHDIRTMSGIGNVNVNAAGDIKTTEDARITTDRLSVSGRNIDLAHSSINPFSARINLVSDGGNIGLRSEKGDLWLGKVAVENAANTSRIDLTANGSIYTMEEDSLVTAPAINLTSETGVIGVEAIPLRVKAGSTVTSSDLDDSSLSARARGNIFIEQVDGDMRLASVKSENGDVTLIARNGSIIDATNGVDEISDSADVIARWQRLGLIHDNDKEDESANAAKEAKAVRLASVEARMNQLASTSTEKGLAVDENKVKAYKAAADAYIKDASIVKAKADYLDAVRKATTEEARTAALEKLQAARDAYFNGKGFTVGEASLIADYGDLLGSTDYGWSLNELLYAVQDSIVNSAPGTIDLVRHPNVTGNNITLIAENGGIGYDADSKYIGNEDLLKTENMRIMASAKPGDLVWDANGVTVKRQMPVTVDVAEGGFVQFTGKNNVYVSATEDSSLYIKGGINTGGDIRLSAGLGISIEEGTQISGRNLSLFSGMGDIGSKDKFMELMINGWLMANSGQSVYVHQNGLIPLKIMSVAAGLDANLDSDFGIRMADVYGMDMGYINAGRNVDLLARHGFIRDIRVLDNGARISSHSEGGKASIRRVGANKYAIEEEDA